jgi:MFS family permease
MYGRKYIQLAASVFGIIGSVIAGTAKSMRVLMISSAIFSIGYAGHQLALASIVETVPRRHRALAIGIFMGALIPARGFSPLIGAVFTVHSSWRALFWLSLGLYTFSLSYSADDISGSRKFLEERKAVRLYWSVSHACRYHHHRSWSHFWRYCLPMVCSRAASSLRSQNINL